MSGGAIGGGGLSHHHTPPAAPPAAAVAPILTLCAPRRHSPCPRRPEPLSHHHLSIKYDCFLLSCIFMFPAAASRLPSRPSPRRGLRAWRPHQAQLVVAVTHLAERRLIKVRAPQRGWSGGARVASLGVLDHLHLLIFRHPVGELRGSPGALICTDSRAAAALTPWPARLARGAAAVRRGYTFTPPPPITARSGWPPRLLSLCYG